MIPDASGRGHGRETSRETFRARARTARVVPVVRQLSADWWTPVAAFHRLAGDRGNTFLLESVEGGERLGRYSFLGRSPFLIVSSEGGGLRLSGPEAGRHSDLSSEPLTAIQQLLTAYRVPPDLAMPPLVAGAVGYFGYDTVRWVEDLRGPNKPGPSMAEMTLLFLEEMAAFDHVHRRLYLVVNARVHPEDDPDASFDRARERLAGMEEALMAPMAPPPTRWIPQPGALHLEANMSKGSFLERVRRAQEYIASGEIFQVVLSQRFDVSCSISDLSLYRALRTINPSPYMFLLRLDGWSAVGSSPEPLLRVEGDRLTYRPIAGTAPRSGDPVADRNRAVALRKDPKERAEHVMLVDLGRNDLGRCAVPGTVEVDNLMAVEYYSHVMHLVSSLSGRLRPGLGPLDALYACFPAGTVSGAPKVRAMEIIEELEPDRRGIYAGAVGYVDFSGNLDTCIALRTMIVETGRVRVQAGAGIVADSVPEREYEETRQKAQALLDAVALATPEGSP